MTSTIDTSVFSKPDFNVKDWINSVLKPSDQDNESIALVTRLQMVSDTTSQQFDTLTNTVIKSMPRLLYDLKSITDDASHTKERVERVKKDYLNLMEGGSAELALEKLKRPHIVKTHMEQCRSLLKEAENWSHLEVEAEKAIENLQFEDAANRLQSAQHSLDVFQNTAEYEIRIKLLERLQDELKSRMKAEVIKSLQQHDSVACYRYYKIYGKIGRSEDFIDLYFEVRNPVVLQNWIDDQSQLDTRLNRFYKALISMLSDEYVWSASIFPDPKPVIQALVQHILESLDPSASQCLETMQEEMKQNALPTLVSAFKVTETFGLALEKLFSKPPVITASTEQGFDTHIKSTRRHSRSGSISLVPLTLRQSADSNAWSYILYEPFLPIQSQYGHLEQAFLEHHLRDIFKKSTFTTLLQSGGSMEIVQYIAQDIISNVFQSARESIDRCLTLTHGFGGVEWLKAFNHYIKSTLNEIRKVAYRVENRSNKDAASNQQEQEDDKRRRSEDELYDFEFELEKGDDSTFQVGLRLLGICQSIDQHVTGIEDTVSREYEFVKSIVLFGKEDHVQPPPTPTNERPLHKRSSSIDQWRSHERKRSSSGGTDFLMNQNITNTEKYPRASISLLQTSILNTHELQSLMTQVSSLSEEKKGKSAIGKMLTSCESEIQSFTEHCQHFVHDAVKAPIKRCLTTIPTMENIWTVEDENQEEDEEHMATTDIQVPQLSLSPNEYITHVGEQLLMLPQQFEVYAHDDALSYRIESLPYIKDYEEEHDDDGDENNEDNTGEKENNGNEEEEEEEEDSKKSNERAIELWTTSVARGTMVEFIAEIKKIRNMTYHGGRQLRTDIEYLINVLSTLDVQPLPELLEMYRYFDLEESDLIKQLMNAKKNPNQDEALKAVAEIRGVVLLEL